MAEKRGNSGTALPRPGIRRRVLVVDDTADARDVLARFLEILGHEVRIAGSGREALDLAASFQPDIILLDIGMPELDGYEVCSRLRASPRNSRAAIYAITGFGSDEHRRRSARAGFDAHFTKPLDLSMLADVIRG